MGFYSDAFRLEHTYIIREIVVHGCPRQRWKRGCRDAEGPCDGLARPAARAALVSFGPASGSQDGSSGACRRVSPPAQQLWGLQRGFAPQHSSAGACRRVFPGCCSVQWGCCSSTRTSLGVLTRPCIAPSSFIFLF